MKIDTDAIKSSVSQQDIKSLIEKEISSGKLSKFNINNIKMLASVKEGELKGAIYLEGNASHPQMFTILAYEKDPSTWLLKLPSVQINK